MNTFIKKRIMKTKDVDNILDIPNIEKWLDVIFTLSCYEGGDKVLYYNATVDNVTCDLNIYLDEEINFIEGEKKLSDLIIIKDIGLFEFKVGTETKKWNDKIGYWYCETIDVFQSHWYRPFLAKEEREY